MARSKSLHFPARCRERVRAAACAVTGKVPGIIYGGEQPAKNVEFDHNNLFHHLKLEAFHASILSMIVDGAKERVLLRDVQMHPWKQLVLHVDFQRVVGQQEDSHESAVALRQCRHCPGG